MTQLTYLRCVLFGGRGNVKYILFYFIFSILFSSRDQEWDGRALQQKRVRRPGSGVENRIETERPKNTIEPRTNNDRERRQQERAAKRRAQSNLQNLLCVSLRFVCRRATLRFCSADRLDIARKSAGHLAGDARRRCEPRGRGLEVRRPFEVSRESQNISERYRRLLRRMSSARIRVIQTCPGNSR
jgi:hypothetical protein